MEAEGAEIPAVETGDDGSEARGAIGGAQRLEPAWAAAFGKACVRGLETVGQGADEGGGDEGHVPRHADDRCGGFGDGGMEPAERAAAGPEVGSHAKVGGPAWGVGTVRDEEGWLAQRRGHGGDQPVENALAAHGFQALGPPAEAGRPAAGQDRAANAQ